VGGREREEWELSFLLGERMKNERKEGKN